MIYLDNAATTPIASEVLEAMLPYLKEQFGNPDSKYYDLAEDAKLAIQKARNQVALLLNSDPDEVVFNSGATEGNNTVLKGVAKTLSSKGKHIISTSVEHSSVHEILKFLESEGFEVTYLKVDMNCQINLEEFYNTVREDTILVSVMWVNNEVGAIFPIEEIAQFCMEKNIYFHTDATQAVGKIEIDLKKNPGISFLTFSGHKIFGPKGIGVMIFTKDRQGIPRKLIPLMHGGEQEYGYRAGTSNVFSIVGLGKAAELAKTRFEENHIKLVALEKKLLEKLFDKFSGVIEVNFVSNRIVGIINVRFNNINNQVLIKNLTDYICVSSGSACSNSKPSRILLAMGYSKKHVGESVRLSLSPYNTLDELDIIDHL